MIGQLRIACVVGVDRRVAAVKMRMGMMIWLYVEDRLEDGEGAEVVVEARWR